MPNKIDRNFTGIKFGICFPYVKYSININKNIGVNRSFKCSHVLSFTALNRPTIGFSPDQVYVKCKSVPIISVKIIPAICQFFNFKRNAPFRLFYEKQTSGMPDQKIIFKRDFLFTLIVK